jgi:protein-L-isoaspartate(D-aspartate) O-methyltransferase
MREQNEETATERSRAAEIGADHPMERTAATSFPGTPTGVSGAMIEGRPPRLRRVLQVLILAALGIASAVAAASMLAKTPSDDSSVWEKDRRSMIERHLRNRGISSPAVLAAMEEVPRHRFVPAGHQAEAYGDHPLPIGLGQTISQPYIVALMTELLEPKRNQRVLEIGTGSGYQAAILSRVVAEVYSIEIVDELARRATRTLAELGYDNVHVRSGDGYDGWPEQAPFDAVILTAAPPRIPAPLLEQLRPGGRMVLPLGEATQDLLVLTRTADGYDRRVVAPVRFVPMTGKVQGRP